MVTMYIITAGKDILVGGGRMPYRWALDEIMYGQGKDCPWFSLHDGDTLSGEYDRPDAITALKQLAGV